MKIAVASIDGAIVAPNIAAARGILVFEVSGNEVALHRSSPLDGGWSIPKAALTRIENAGRSLVSVAAPAKPSTGALPPDLLREMLDCQIVIAGAFVEEERQALQRLGLLALPAFASQPAEAAVRFVVSGSPPLEGEACGPCPKRPIAG
ncbi:MAG: hypothetical protein U5J83_09425 [Bryobacterales bacterium]|nr:hypothetical protein [Bryobacterales bacterium]